MRGVIIILIIQFFLQALQAKELRHFERIDVNERDGSFDRTIEIYGESNARDPIYHVHNAFIDVESFELRIWDNNKWKKVAKRKVSTSDYTYHSFFDDTKVIVSFIPPKTRYKLVIKEKCSELMLFSHIQLQSNESRPTYEYEINIPKEYKFSLMTTSPSDSAYFRVVNQDSFGIRKVVVKSKKGDLKTTKTGYIRCIIHPEDISIQDHFRNWEQEICKDVPPINQSIKSELDLITKGLTDPLAIADTVFHYINKQIRYVAIETQYGKWVYRDPNQVFENQRGDCKDMANLLTEALKYKGVEAYYALIPSLSMDIDSCLPVISGANHAICVAFINGETYSLDATDNQSSLLIPSRHTQGQGYWIPANNRRGRVAVVDPDSNSIDIQLNVNEKMVAGIISFRGFQKVKLDEELRSRNDHETLAKEMVGKFVFGRVKSAVIEQGKHEITVKCEIQLNKHPFTTIGEKKIFQLFNVANLQVMEPDSNDLPNYTYGTLSKKARVMISLPEEIPHNDENILTELQDNFGLNVKVEDHTLIFDSTYKRGVVRFDHSNIEEQLKITRSYNDLMTSIVTFE